VRHVGHTVRVALSIVVAAVPAIVADPAVQHFITAHPFAAAYFPIVSGIVYALWRAARTRARVAAPPSTGSQTMGAK
jgi:hypothetical protein